MSILHRRRKVCERQADAVAKAEKRAAARKKAAKTRAKKKTAKRKPKKA